MLNSNYITTAGDFLYALKSVFSCYMKGEMLMKQEKLFEKNDYLTQEELHIVYENLDITDDFMFGKVMQEEKNSIELLECLTGNQIDSVKTAIGGQKVIKILFFNTKGTIVNVSKKTSDLLKYMETAK